MSRAVVDALWESERFLKFEVHTQPRVHGSPNTGYQANWDAEQSLFGGSAPTAFNGSGVLVGVTDTGVDLTHCRHLHGDTACDLLATQAPSGSPTVQVLRYPSTDCTDSDGHGTHVVGSVLSLAPGARVVVVDAHASTSVDDTLSFSVSDIFRQPLAMGARIFSFSFSDYEHAYGALSTLIDDYARQHDLLVLVAAGNDGNLLVDCAGGQLTNPSNARNVLTVGALAAGRSFFESGGLPTGCSVGDACSQGHQVYWKSMPGAPFTTPSDGYWGSWTAPAAVAYFSSEGPTLTGGRGADVAAPGMYVLSDHSNAGRSGDACAAEERLTSMQGTSMATPLVAGVAARMQLSLIHI